MSEDNRAIAQKHKSALTHSDGRGASSLHGALRNPRQLAAPHRQGIGGASPPTR